MPIFSSGDVRGGIAKSRVLWYAFGVFFSLYLFVGKFNGICWAECNINIPLYNIKKNETIGGSFNWLLHLNVDLCLE